MTTLNFNSKQFRNLSERVFLDLHSGQCLNGIIVYIGFTLRDIPHFACKQAPHIIKHVRLYEPTKNGNFKLVKNKYIPAVRQLAA